MTDKEIVQALRCCADYSCSAKCPAFPAGLDCREEMHKEVLALLERLTAENAALREKQRWILVTERPPEKQAWYHVAIRDKKTMRVSVEQDLYSVETAKNFGHEIGFCKANRWPEREELIAWMQFPSAPEAPEEGDKHE
jgi:hypothetical protein